MKDKKYIVIYRFKGEGMKCYKSVTTSPTKKELRKSYDSSVVIKSVLTEAEWKAL